MFDVIIGYANNGKIVEASFLQHCTQRRTYCEHEMRLLKMAYPQVLLSYGDVVPGAAQQLCA
jgi:hypothetical protein